jgi:DNA-binding IclR family transcriptional regulator
MGVGAIRLAQRREAWADGRGGGTVVDADGNTLAALAAIGSADHFTTDALAQLVVPQLQRAAAAASRALAHA